MLKCIIVEDDRLSQEALVDTITKHIPSVQVMSICGTPEEGIKSIRDTLPDLLFLDVELPGMTGFDMLKFVSDIDFEIIFTTSYNEYVLEAMRNNAFDYLLKPINPNELRSSINRLIQKKVKVRNQRLDQLSENLNNRNNKNRRIALPTFEGFIFISIRDIVHCDSESNYTTIHLINGDRIMVTRTLKEIEELVGSTDFFRVHHSHFVNLSCIKRYVRGSGGYVVMNNGTTINVARNRKDDFFKALERV